MGSKNICDVNSALSILQVLKYSTGVMIEFVFEHEELFVDEFIGGYIIAFTKLSFDDDNVHFVYVADSGTHICDYISMERFITWVQVIFKEEL